MTRSERDHRCDHRCLCPNHDTPMYYAPSTGEHCCQDIDCEYGHGTFLTRPDNDAQPDYRQPHTHNPRCRGGWIGGRNTDTPTPCLTCKPWLAGSHLTDGPHPRETSTP